jgi:hypothetical protein
MLTTDYIRSRKYHIKIIKKHVDPQWRHNEGENDEVMHVARGRRGLNLCGKKVWQ